MSDPLVTPAPPGFVNVRVVLSVTPRRGISVHRTCVERALYEQTPGIHVFVEEDVPVERAMGLDAVVERDVVAATQAVVRLTRCPTEIAHEAVQQAAHGNATFLQQILKHDLYLTTAPEELVRYFAHYYAP